MSPRAIAARLLLDASGLLGSAGPRLAALCARAADVASDAAHLVSPMATCEGCGAAVPALALVGVEVCGECQRAEEEGPAAAAPVDLRGLTWPAMRASPRSDDADPADRSKLN